MSDIAIEEFQPQHFEQALRILHESNCLHAQNDPQQFLCAPESNSIPYLQCILSHPDNFGYVALDGSKVVGLLCAGELVRDENIYVNRKYYQIFDIVVSSSHQKRGIGKKLISRLAEEAKTDGIKQIELEVFSFNNNAVAFYRHLNFRETSRNMSLYL